jgi:cytochrome c
MMDSWERFKIGAAITGTALFMLGLRWISDLAFPERYLVEPAYKIAGVSETAVDLSSLQKTWPAGFSGQWRRAELRHYMGNIEKATVPLSAEGSPVLAAPAAPVDLGTSLAAADVEKGKQSARVCTSCHTFDQGGQDRTGPGLWNIVGRDIAAHGAFAYSSALAAQPGDWTYEQLDRYLTNPAKAVPGNKMAFNGIRNAQARANVIAFLSTLSASRVPFPKAEAPKAVEAPTERSEAAPAAAGG